MRKLKQKDIREHIKISKNLELLYAAGFNAFNNYEPVGLSHAREIIKELCSIYSLPKLKNIIFNKKECSRINANAYFQQPDTIAFKNPNQIVFRIIFHEFAHYLDYMWNKSNRITLDCVSDKCNGLADDFAGLFAYKLWKKYLNL